MGSDNLLWLSDELGKKLENVRKNAAKKFKPSPLDQVEHGLDHCKCIENNLHHLLPSKDIFSQLSERERFILLASPWIINIGWEDGITQYKNSSVWLEDEDNRQLLGLEEDDYKIFDFMIRYHPFMEDLEACPETIPIESESIRVPLLTSYLRLADAIHVDKTGGPTSLFYFLREYHSPELFHWLKGKLQPIIRPEPQENIIEVNINTQMNPSEQLIETIRSEIELYVDSVKNIMVKGGITEYLSVKVNCYDGPAISADKKIEFEKLMREFSLTFPPNAGMLQSLYLSTIKEVCQIRKNSDLKNQIKEINQIQEIAKEVNSFRPCHMGLERYTKQCDENIKKHLSDEEKLMQIDKWAENSISERNERLVKVYKNASESLIKFDHFILFGFSSTVTESFKEMHKKTKRLIYIYVCEAHNKSRLNAARKLVYIDGINYAEQLDIVYPSAKIYIIPDITVASLFESKQNEKWVMVFGANGITGDGHCGHSAGHLSLAIIAKHYKVPVYILCDSYKIGIMDKNHGIMERKDQWLKCSSQWQWHQKHNFTFLNLRENIVDSSLIEKIVTEDGTFSTSAFKEKYSS